LGLKFYEKAKILRDELFIDFKYGAYNKAVSCSYFMVEALANAIFSIKKHKTRGFSGRANLVRALFGINAYKDFLRLHELREKADHREVLFGEYDAKDAIEIAENLFETF